MTYAPPDHCVQCGAARGESDRCRVLGTDGVTVTASWQRHRWRDWSPDRLRKMGFRPESSRTCGRMLYRDLIKLPCSCLLRGHRGGTPVCERCGDIIPERAVRTIALYRPEDGGPVVKAIVRRVNAEGSARLAIPVSADQIRLLREPAQYAPDPSPGQWMFDPADLGSH